MGNLMMGRVCFLEEMLVFQLVYAEWTGSLESCSQRRILQE